jgi:hypothetical protein
MGPNNRPAGLFGGQAFACGFRSPFFHGRAKADSFYGADFRKTGGADDEARFAGFSSAALLFWHGRSVPNFLAFGLPSRLGQ